MSTMTTTNDVVALPVRAFMARYGVSRSYTYELMGSNAIRAVKAGNKTLIDAASAAEWYAGLKSATITAPTWKHKSAA